LASVLAHLESQPDILDEFPEIRIFYLIYRCLSDPDNTEDFDTLKSTLQQHAHRFPKGDLLEMYGYAINFCIRKINRGNPEYLGTLLEIYQWALDQEVLLMNGWLSQWDYKNIVSASLRANEYTWCADFIEDYKQKIEPESRENAYTYNLASLLFERGDYGTAMRTLQHVAFSDVFYQLGGRALLLKCFYELDDYEALTSLCDSYKVYLKRNQTLSAHHQGIHRNLISFTKKAADLRNKLPFISAKEGQKKVEKLLAAMAEKGNISQGKWLKEKVSALQK
ncbi:MAG: hypothetical protein AAF570_25265, partial [Bacteroidota bacterium]